MYSKKLIKFAQKLDSEYNKLGTGKIIRMSKANKIDDRYFVSNLHMILETSQPIEDIQYNDVNFDCTGIMDGCFNGIPSEAIKATEMKTVPIGVSLNELKDGIYKVAGRKYGNMVAFRSKVEYPMLNARWLKKVMDVLNCKHMVYYDGKHPVYFYYDDDFQSGVKVIILPIIYNNEGFAGWDNLSKNFYDKNKKYCIGENKI